MKDRKILEDIPNFLLNTDPTRKGIGYMPLSIPVVQYLCIRYAGIESVTLGDLVMCSAEGYAFAYNPQNYYIYYQSLKDYRK